MFRRSLARLVDSILEWIFRQLPDCERTVFDISRSLDDKPGLRRSFMTKLHLITCGACRSYLKQLTFIRTAVRGYAGESMDRTDPPACDLSVEARERIMLAIRTAF